MHKQQPDSAPGNYYVSMVDGSRYSLLLGPFPNNHQKALDMVEPAKKKAIEIDPRAHFYAFGTCRVEFGEDAKIGGLNHLFDLWDLPKGHILTYNDIA